MLTLFYGKPMTSSFREHPVDVSALFVFLCVVLPSRLGSALNRQDAKRKKALKELDFDWGDDKLYLYFQWPEVLIAFYSVIVSLQSSFRVLPLFVLDVG